MALPPRRQVDKVDRLDRLDKLATQCRRVDRWKILAMTKLSAGLMQLGAALFLLPWVFVLLGTGALLPLAPWGAGMAVLGLIIGLASGGA